MLFHSRGNLDSSKKGFITSATKLEMKHLALKLDDALWAFLDEATTTTNKNIIEHTSLLEISSENVAIIFNCRKSTKFV